MSEQDKDDIRIQINDTDILAKLQNTEDSFVERKRFSETSAWLKTAVAFANSAPIGFPALLFIGFKDNGTIEDADNLESVQRKLDAVLNNAYPPIYYWTKVLVDGGKEFVAVIIPGSELRPHFSGRAFVRVEHESRDASEDLLAELIATRNSKVREILKWKGKKIRVDTVNPESVRHAIGRIASSQPLYLKECNSFYVTLTESEWPGSTHRTFPPRRVDIVFDHDHNELVLEISPS